MKKQKSIKINYVLNTLYQVFTLVVPLITAPYVARVLGPTGVGIFSYTNSIVSIFGVFAMLGTSVYGQQVIAQCRDDREKVSKVFWEIELICLGTTLLTMCCWGFFLLLAEQYKIYYIILTLNLLAIGFDVSWLYTGLEDFSLIVARSFCIKILTIIGIFVFVRCQKDLYLYFLIQSIGQVVGNLSLWIPLKSRLIKVCFRNLEFKRHIKQTIIYFLPTIAASIYSYMDKTMIGLITASSEENGYYDQAQRIVNMGYTLVASLNTVMASRIAYLFAKKQTIEIKNRFQKGADFIALLSFPIAAGLFAISDTFIPWFYGEGYEQDIMLLKIASPLVVVLSIHNFLAAQYLVPSGQRAKSTWGVICGAIVNFCMNLLLIPRYSAAGALIATILSELTICFIYFAMSKDYIPISMCIKAAVKPLVSAVIMACLVMKVECNQLNVTGNIALKISVGVVTYYVLAIIFGVGLVKEYTRKLVKHIKYQGTRRKTQK